MTVALVFTAFVLDDRGSSRGKRGAKRRRGSDEEEEELKGLKALQEASEPKKLKILLTTEALRYQQGTIYNCYEKYAYLRFVAGLDAFVAQGKKRKAAFLAEPVSDIHTGSFQCKTLSK